MAKYKIMTSFEKIESWIKSIENNWWTFSKSSKWNWSIAFSIKWIEWEFGYYNLPADNWLYTLHVEILDKPFYISDSKIESLLSEFFEK